MNLNIFQLWLKIPFFTAGHFETVVIKWYVKNILYIGLLNLKYGNSAQKQLKYSFISGVYKIFLSLSLSLSHVCMYIFVCVCVCVYIYKIGFLPSCDYVSAT